MLKTLVLNNPFRVPVFPLIEEVVFGTPNPKRTRVDTFFVPCTTIVAQRTIGSKWKKMEKEVVWECIARWWYDAYIPFNPTNSFFYQPMIDAIASCGSGFEGPSFMMLRGYFYKKGSNNRWMPRGI
jgi:hypothetical protein